MPEVLLRHGAVSAKGLAGWLDVDLSEEGQKEAVAAGKTMKAKGLKCDVVFTPPGLERCWEAKWLYMAI